MTILTDDELKAVRERDLRHRDGRTLMKDVAEGGRDRSALLRHIDALTKQLAQARQHALKEAWDAVDALIVRGHIDERWKNDERNGLILATNVIMQLREETP